MDNGKIRPIAFYLPQYYPTPENDLWWEPGFTEWTNVKRAVPLFKGHCQPRIPAGLGYYDLRDPEIREKQAQMAAEAGIEGFCYWHYWFDGQELLGRVLDEVVASGKPDFPFCMCWANHSWYRKTWEPGKDDRLLIEQTYPGAEDYVRHFNALLPAFKDKRYIKADGRLLFGIFDSDRIPDFPLMRQTWDALAKENGLLISLDPNLRKPLWRSEAEAKAAMEWSLHQADIVKISDEEIDFLWGLSPEAGAEKLLKEFGVSLVYVTLGPKGCYARNASACVMVESPSGIHVVDTTGAGDIFGGSAMSQFLKCGKAPSALTQKELESIVTFACTAASLSTQTRGGITSVPAPEAVLAKIGTEEHLR